MASFKFSGHQTFVFRHGWLEKGVNLLRENPRGFLAEDAIVTLGVGKNMVESIRYWCSQTGLAVDDPGKGGMFLTPLAEFLFGKKKNSGRDPFLEDDATLWLLHYQLVTSPAASAWTMVFNHWNKPEFTKAELVSFIERRLALEHAKVSPKTIERDVDCFVRCYAGTRGKTGDEGFDCPLLSLSLIQATGDGDLYRMNICAKRNLPPELVGYAAVKRLEEMNANSASVQNMLFENRSPGQIFKLDENALIEAVMALEESTGGVIAFTETSGVNNINFRHGHMDKGQYADCLLRSYYGE